MQGSSNMKRMLVSLGGIAVIWASGCAKQDAGAQFVTDPVSKRQLVVETPVEARVNAATYFAYGHLLERRGQLEPAVDQYLKAIELQATFPSAHNRLGICLNKLGRHEEATRAFRLAVQNAPNDAQALNNLGFSEYLSGNFTAAESTLQRALTINPEFARARMNYGLVLAKLGRTQEAYQAFSLVGSPADAHYNLAVVQRDAGDFAAATNSLRSALQSEPDHKLARAQYADLTSRFGEAVDTPNWNSPAYAHAPVEPTYNPAPAPSTPNNAPAANPTVTNGPSSRPNDTPTTPAPRSTPNVGTMTLMTPVTTPNASSSVAATNNRNGPVAGTAPATGNSAAPHTLSPTPVATQTTPKPAPSGPTGPTGMATTMTPAPVSTPAAAASNSSSSKTAQAGTSVKASPAQPAVAAKPADKPASPAAPRGALEEVAPSTGFGRVSAAEASMPTSAPAFNAPMAKPTSKPASDLTPGDRSKFDPPAPPTPSNSEPSPMNDEEDCAEPPDMGGLGERPAPDESHGASDSFNESGESPARGAMKPALAKPVLASHSEPARPQAATGPNPAAPQATNRRVRDLQPIEVKPLNSSPIKLATSPTPGSGGKTSGLESQAARLAQRMPSAPPMVPAPLPMR